jgi:hypothetical protein
MRDLHYYLIHQLLKSKMNPPRLSGSAALDRFSSLALLPGFGCLTHCRLCQLQRRRSTLSKVSSHQPRAKLRDRISVCRGSFLRNQVDWGFSSTRLADALSLLLHETSSFARGSDGQGASYIRASETPTTFHDPLCAVRRSHLREGFHVSS